MSERKGLADRMKIAVQELSRSHPTLDQFSDGQVAEQWQGWLGQDLPWVGKTVTDDEFFFITTLCGTMTLAGQRTHIRKFLPMFAGATGSDIRGLSRTLLETWQLRSPWMKHRLAKMAEVLRDRNIDMDTYTGRLRMAEQRATPWDPMPALDALVDDHGGSSHKTLAIFVRDCVLGNSFPIDTRVESVLGRYELPADERRLVSAALSLELNPRSVARLFYKAGGSGVVFTSSPRE